MIRILFTAAEQEEIDCAQQALRVYESRIAGKVQVDFLLTGIGTASTCYRLTKKLAEAEAEGNKFSLVINIGIAGSYDTGSFPVGSVALIEKEYFGDLGFQTSSGFISLFDSASLDSNLFPYTDGALNSVKLPDYFEELIKSYKRAVGVTVQTVTGTDETKSQIVKRYNPQIESMEGAAFFYVCLNEHVNFFELRSVSNAVGVKDSSKWDTPSALRSLTETCKDFLSKME
ncbi:MAG: futalosine hydrolase [Bacteroidales bacterium]|jgi:futalosine hydrolase|nr:futalosine hydrolase [Bacteroidales bacterium]MCI1733174.1 futalosine hydrolase [Bacteroidales bacterium]